MLETWVEDGIRILAWAPVVVLLHITVLFVGQTLFKALPGMPCPHFDPEHSQAPWHFIVGMAALGSLTLMLTFVTLVYPGFSGAMRYIGLLLMIAAILQLFLRRELPHLGLAAWSYLSAYIFLMSFQFLIQPNFTDDTAANNFLMGLPIDYKISLMFAQSLLEGQLLTFGDWLGSDRPPLLSGFILLFAGPNVSLENSYLFVGTAVQLLIVPTMVSIIKLVSPRGAADTVMCCLVIGCMITSPLFIHNISFLWPKILSASYLLCAVYIMFLLPISNRLTPVLSGIFLALSFLSHGGSAFAILALGMAFIIRNRTLAGFIFSAANLAVFIAIYMPWMAYQKLVQPPGDRLLKWHLADHIPVTDKSLFDLLAEKYRNIGPTDIFDRLVTSLDAQLVEPYHALSTFIFSGTEDIYGLVALIVEGSFSSTALAIGFFTLPITTGLLLFTRNRTVFVVFAIWTACFLSWALLPFRGAILVHEGSYIIQVLPWLAIAMGLAAVRTIRIQATILVILALQAVVQLGLFWEYRAARMFPSTTGWGTAVSIIGDIGGTTYEQASIRDGIRVVGTRAAGGDSDLADVTLQLDQASRIRYITGPDATGQRLLVFGPDSETLLYVNEIKYGHWTVLRFARESPVTVRLVDDGTGWGQWSAVEVLE